MNDVMKKRLIGVAVLVVIGVLVPLLLSKCMHGGSDDDGQAEEADNAPRTPEALSPQSAASDNSTPTVRGNDDSDSSSSARAPSSSQSQNRESSSSQPSQTSTRSSAPTAQRNDSARGWLVQIAAFGDADNAKKLVSQLSGQYRASYAQAEVNGKTWYRVNVGPFTSEGAARSSADSLRSQGRKPLVRHLP